jgi:alkaline phosphatase/streptomycin-6-phosphatase
MRNTRLTAVLAASAAITAVGVGTAAATGSFSSKHGDRDKERGVREALSHEHPRNVIFLLGDGMGTQEITAARYYQGVNNRLNVDRMPLTGFDTTWSVKPAASPPYLPDYDPDSASTGTMWSTGQKTIDERIAQGPSSADTVPGKDLKTVLEIAQRRGMKVGDVSTAEITDATPAVLASHINLRGCQGPADMAPCTAARKENGGLGSIAEQGGRPQGERAPRWRPRPLRADDHGRPGYRQDRRPVRPGQRLPVRDRYDGPERDLQLEQAGAGPVQPQQHVAGVERPGRLNRDGEPRSFLQ